VIKRRLAAYRGALAARSATMLSRERKSLNAELEVVRHLEALPSVLQVWHAIRIPDPSRARGAGEVDVVALTPWGLLGFEVKNWVGEVAVEDGDLIQLRRRARGKTPTVLPRLHKKAAHMKRMALSLYADPALEVAHAVVLPNKSTRMSHEVKQHPNIVNLHDLEGFITQAFAKHDLLTEAKLDQYADMIERCGSWDSISFGGGQIHNGDIDDDKLPLGWQRSAIKTVEIELHGGLLRTLLRGLRVKVKTTSWDGVEDTQIVAADGVCVTHTMPWGASGVDGEGTHPLAHLQSIRFGSQIPFTKAAAALATTPAVAEDDGSTSLDDTDANRSEADSLRALFERFQPGDAVTGTVLKHLKDDSGVTYALLVELVARKVKGIIYMDQFDDVNPAFFDAFYGPEKPVDVIIQSNDNGRIKLKR
jgi:hypothetical protein